MLQAYTDGSQSLITNSAIKFINTAFQTGNTAILYSSGTTIHLNRTGYYLVAFNATAYNDDATGSNISVRLYKNGTPQANAYSSDFSDSESDDAALAFTTIIQVKPSCYTIDNNVALQFVNTGAAATYLHANVVVTKIA